MTPTDASIGRLYVGSSGFSYPTWLGDFYPAGTKQKEFLRHYASRLPAVEVNSTFYNLPSESTVAGWAEATPPEFQFAIKMNRRIVQFGRVDLAAAFCERIRPLGERLGPIRVLIGRSRDEGWLRLLLDSLDPELDYAFEFRHESWEAKEILAGFFKHEDAPTAPAYAARLGELVEQRLGTPG